MSLTNSKFQHSFSAVLKTAEEFGVMDPQVFIETEEGDLLPIKGIVFSHLNGGEVHIITEEED